MSTKHPRGAGLASPVRRTRRTAEAARELVLAAAEAVLMARGPAGLKLTEIARAAGVTNGTVLHHFGTIEGVQRALIDRLARRVADRAIAITRQEGPVETRLAKGLAELFLVFGDPAAARLSAWLALTHETAHLEGVGAAIREVRQAIRETQARQGLPVGHVELDAMLLGGIMLALSVGLFGADLARFLEEKSSYAEEVAKALLWAAASTRMPPA